MRRILVDDFLVYPIIQVPPDASDMPEQLGTKRKFWYRTPENTQVLFKEGRPNTGENWAEKVACELAELLGLPHAIYDLAEWRDHKGVVTPSFVPEGSRLVLGNELLGKLIKDYPHQTRYKARQHTVQVVMAIMKWPLIGMPLGYVPPQGLAQAADIFTGYLLLDALISNQDRHHENWGLIMSPGRKVTLAPTFDHASSLGRNEPDEVRSRRLETKDQGDSVEQYVARAKSAFYQTLKAVKPLSTLAVFEEAAKLAPDAARIWIERLRQISADQCENVYVNVPAIEMSVPARRFASQMIQANRARLLALQ